MISDFTKTKEIQNAKIKFQNDTSKQNALD